MAHIISTLRSPILTIDWPENGSNRARKVISRSKARATGKYPSWKMGRMVHWESPHELNAYRLLDANPDVISFHEQPLVIRYILGGIEHLHYPDVLVNYSGGRELWEIKTSRDAADPEVAARTRLMQAALPNNGFVYRVVVGEDLAREPRLSTVLTLLRYGREPVTLPEREHVRQLLLATTTLNWASGDSAGLGNRGRFILARLSLEGDLSVDLESPLTPATLFTHRTKQAQGV